MSKMQKPAPQQQPDSATAYALAALTGFSLALTGCEKQAPQPPAKENHPPQATVHVQVAQPSLSPSEAVTLHRMFVQIADQSRADKNAAKLYVALQDPKVRAFFIELRDGSGSFIKNQFDGTNPELGQSIVRVLQHSANVMNRDLPPRILDLQRAAREGHKQLPAATEAARKALAAAQAEESAYNQTNKTWNMALSDKVRHAQFTLQNAEYLQRWEPKSALATWKESKVAPLALDGSFGRGTEVALATAFDRAGMLRSSAPYQTPKGANDTGFSSRHVKVLEANVPGFAEWLKADAKTIHEAAQAGIRR